jgi:hypothetical protein
MDYLREFKEFLWITTVMLIVAFVVLTAVTKT